MAGRLIPKKTKVRTEFYKNLSISDAVLILVLIMLEALILLSNMGVFKWVLAIAFAVIGFVLLISVAPDTRLYQAMGALFRYLFGTKNFKRSKVVGPKNVSSLMPYSGVMSDGVIDFKEYYARVIEIMPVEYYMLTLERQNAFITAVDNAIKILSAGQTAMIIKLERPLVLDKYISNEKKKLEEMKEALENKALKPRELQPREEIVQIRVNGLETSNAGMEDYYIKEHYYMVVFGEQKTSLTSTVKLMINTMEGGTNGTLKCNLLDQQQTAVFLKNTYYDDFDEREVEKVREEDLMQWIMPEKVDFHASSYAIDSKPQKFYAIAGYPTTVSNAWGNAFFNVTGSKVVVKFKTVDQGDAESRLDKAIMEMQIQASKRGRMSKEIEKNTHLDSLQELLIALKAGNEVLFDTHVYISVKEEGKKALKQMLRRGHFKYNELFGRQKEAFISANVSRRTNMKALEQGINSSSLAAIFPFISDAVQDEKGIFIGMNTEPFLIDFFQRDTMRINSNMIVLGKSGSGKSYGVSGLLAHLAADNSRVFVLDPEKEYVNLTNALGGKIIDVGTATQGRINPFHVVTSLEDEGDQGKNVSLAAHLQFLEEFFRIILDGITKDALEVLNECVKELYAKFKITDTTDITKLKPTEFPIFDDLFKFVVAKYDKEKDDFMLNNLRIIRTYLIKFASGGRNSNLWNGPSSITTDENFICFMFQSLLANKNEGIANAQMLLVMRWLENEIFKNKDYNQKYKTKRKVVVAIDEAHVFIDPRRPTALDFMFQLAKRIRKYEGMQIVISQNIQDFVGSPDIARKSTAIINASQFSMIFSLAPNDINHMVSLYEKSGGINESEQEAIVSAPRGRCFFITGSYSRTSVQIIYSQDIEDLFLKNRTREDGSFITAPEFAEIKRQEQEAADLREQARLREVEEEKARKHDSEGGDGNDS